MQIGVESFGWSDIVVVDVDLFVLFIVVLDVFGQNDIIVYIGDEVLFLVVFFGFGLLVVW